MGVLACDRKGCENIMCDRHSQKFGYICNSCFEELLQSNIIDIDAFMNSEKVDRKLPLDIREKWLDEEFSKV